MTDKSVIGFSHHSVNWVVLLTLSAPLTLILFFLAYGLSFCVEHVGCQRRVSQTVMCLIKDVLAMHGINVTSTSYFELNLLKWHDSKNVSCAENCCHWLNYSTSFKGGIVRIWSAHCVWLTSLRMCSVLCQCFVRQSVSVKHLCFSSVYRFWSHNTMLPLLFICDWCRVRLAATVV